LVDFDGKVAVVVGASVGIGAATVRQFSDLGAAVVLASRNVDAIDALAAELREQGRQAEAVQVDVARAGDVERAVEVAVERFGGLDYAVNNAGVQGPAAPAADQPEEEWDRILAINLKGVWLSMRAEVPALLARGGGAIVNVASVGGLVAAPGISPYCASKHGVIGLSKSAALDYAEQGIRINVVAPGAIDTAIFNNWQETDEQREHMASLHPLKRIGRPDEVAGAIAWLCSDSSSYVTGAVMPVDGGYIVL
jgi:NAD(P)-dependent dehydrogenase (short-subunit alcohol dehydrogenase family)